MNRARRFGKLHGMPCCKTEALSLKCAEIHSPSVQGDRGLKSWLRRNFMIYPSDACPALSS